ncbi:MULTISPECIES: hypothetical protein [unclassified Duganella]|uniref:hypothetical protein n=1 Tax=unclassified Duganella TaxID=2636909 RepID=UPI0013EEA4A5|nr:MULTISPECIES: hypothetical protein [unclassified Duganella]
MLLLTHISHRTGLVLPVARSGPAGGSCVRITPSLFTGPADLDRLVAAIREIAAR